MVLPMIIRRSFSKSSWVPWIPDSIPLSFVKQEGRKKNPTSIIFLHGLFGNKNNWRSIARRITDVSGRNSYCLDLRNHGDSPHTDPIESGVLACAADLKSFLDREEMSRAVIAGHSMGGRVAMQFAALYPECVRQLFVFDMSPVSMPSFSVNSLAKYIECMERITNEVPAVKITLSNARIQANNILSTCVEEKLVRDFLLMNLIKDDTGTRLKWKFNLEAIKDLVCNGSIREIYLPSDSPAFEGETVFIHGGKSDFVKEQDKEDILKLFPKSRFHCIPDAGHYLHVEKQKEFLDILVSYL